MSAIYLVELDPGACLLIKLGTLRLNEEACSERARENPMKMIGIIGGMSWESSAKYYPVDKAVTLALAA